MTGRFVITESIDPRRKMHSVRPSLLTHPSPSGAGVFIGGGSFFGAGFCAPRAGTRPSAAAPVRIEIIARIFCLRFTEVRASVTAPGKGMVASWAGRGRTRDYGPLRPQD